MILCEKCGELNPDGAVLCSMCGAKISKGETPASSSAAKPTVNNAAPRPPAGPQAPRPIAVNRPPVAEDAPTRPGMSTGRMAAAIIGIIVILLSGVVIVKHKLAGPHAPAQPVAVQSPAPTPSPAPAATAPTAKPVSTVSTKEELQALNNALLDYIKNNQNFFPVMTSINDVQRALGSSVDPKLFVNPETGRWFNSNPYLTNKNMSDILVPAEMATFYAEGDDGDGKRAVAYADGHVDLVPEAFFMRQEKVRSRIP